LLVVGAVCAFLARAVCGDFKGACDCVDPLFEPEGELGALSRGDLITRWPVLMSLCSVRFSLGLSMLDVLDAVDRFDDARGLDADGEEI